MLIFFYLQNLDSRKFIQLFDWKWVNGQDSIGCSSFFGQIPSFRPRKWHFFFENFHFSDFFSCIGIQVRANLWSFSIGNGSTAKCPSEVLYLSAKFHRFGSEMAFFLKIFISVSFFFGVGIQVHANLWSFSIGKGSTAKSPSEVHRFLPNSIVSASEMAFLWKFTFRCSVFLFYFCAKIQVHTNWCNFSIGNRLIYRTP